MVLRESVVKVSCKDDTCTVDQDVQLRLILFLTLVLIEGAHANRRFLLIVLLNELVLDSFHQILALVVISDVCNDHSGLGWELGRYTLESDFILSYEDNVGALIQIPEAYRLSNSTGGTCDDNSFIKEVVWEILLKTSHILGSLPHHTALGVVSQILSARGVVIEVIDTSGSILIIHVHIALVTWGEAIT
jgi:hypothetical protein